MRTLIILILLAVFLFNVDNCSFAFQTKGDNYGVVWDKATRDISFDWPPENRPVVFTNPN